MHATHLTLPPGALEISSNLVNSAADLVPASVPRGVAKGGVAVLGGLVVLGLLQKVRVCVT
jgi:hypothetical protein